MAERTYTRFIILGTARTGSSLLWSLLNSHPDILCTRGIFGSKNKINFGQYHSPHDPECRHETLIKIRNNESVRFLNEQIFKKYEKPYQAVGFKYFYDHGKHLKDFTSIEDYILNNEDIKVIHLKRENLLASLVSYKRALSENHWINESISVKPNAELFTTELAPEECEEYFNRISRYQEYFDEGLRGRTLQLSYQSLLNAMQSSLNSIQEFLGVKPQELSTNLRSNNPIPLSESVLNYDELKDYFAMSVYARFFQPE